MRRVISLGITLLLSSVAFAQEPMHDHMAMLRAMIKANSSHGPVIPQPDAVNPTVAKTFNMTAKSFEFDISPLPFVVNQGDVVTLNITVPSGDQAGSHGLLMETYVENGFVVARGTTRTLTFTATTVGTFAFVCAVPTCGTGHDNMTGTFMVNAAVVQPPTVSSVTPNNGPPSGGTSVTISGANFQNNATVKFGGVAATNIIVSSSTTLTATTPAHGAGAVDVVVTNGDGQSGTLSGGFTYVVPQPTIDSITPSSGPTSGSTLVTIKGSNFQSGATVTIGGIAANDVTVVDPATITALTPLGPASEEVAVKMDVAVKNPSNTSATLAGAFQYTVPPLAVTLITPSAAQPAGGTKIDISGAGFTNALPMSITIGGVAATNVQVVDAITLSATVPAHAVGPVNVVVTIGGTTFTAKGMFGYLNAPPRHRPAKH